MRGEGWSRVTHPFATVYPPKGGLIVRLACVRRAASVHPEPGSNSPFKKTLAYEQLLTFMLKRHLFEDHNDLGVHLSYSYKLISLMSDKPIPA